MCSTLKLGTVPIYSCLVLLTSNKMVSGANHTSLLELYFLFYCVTRCVPGTISGTWAPRLLTRPHTTDASSDATPDAACVTPPHLAAAVAPPRVASRTAQTSP